MKNKLHERIKILRDIREIKPIPYSIIYDMVGDFATVYYQGKLIDCKCWLNSFEPDKMQIPEGSLYEGEFTWRFQYGLPIRNGLHTGSHLKIEQRSKKGTFVFYVDSFSVYEDTIEIGYKVDVSK